MQSFYFVLAAAHVLAMVATGVLWTIFDLKPQFGLRPHLRDIRAVHFGCLYLVPWFLGLAFAFERLRVPACLVAALLWTAGVLTVYALA